MMPRGKLQAVLDKLLGPDLPTGKELWEFPGESNDSRARARRVFLNLAVDRIPEFARTLLEWRDAKRWANAWCLDGGAAEARFIEWGETVLSEAADRELRRDQWLAAANASDAVELSILGPVFPPPDLDESNLAWIKRIGPPVRASRGRRTAAMDRAIATARMALDRLTESKARMTPTPARQAKIDAAQAILTKAEITARDAQSEPRFVARGLDGRPLVVEPWRPDLKTRVQYRADVESYADAVERQARAAGMVPAIRITKPYFFDWLVRRQLQRQPVAQIAKEMPPNDDGRKVRRAEADRHAVDEALKRLAKRIGLKLLKNPRP